MTAVREHIKVEPTFGYEMKVPVKGIADITECDNRYISLDNVIEVSMEMDKDTVDTESVLQVTVGIPAWQAKKIGNIYISGKQFPVYGKLLPA